MTMPNIRYSVIAFKTGSNVFRALNRFKHPIDTGLYRLFFLVGMPMFSIAIIRYN